MSSVGCMWQKKGKTKVSIINIMIYVPQPAIQSEICLLESLALGKGYL